MLLMGLVACGNTDEKSDTSTEDMVSMEDQTTGDAKEESEISEETTDSETGANILVEEIYPAGESEQEDADEEEAMKLYFNDSEIPVTWENNETVEALMAAVEEGEIVVDMSMYGGWEQVGSLGKSYPRNDTQMTTKNGDIVLYSGNQIVVFYGENSWSYTKLGEMNLPEDEVTELLSNGDIRLKLSQ